jgi:hypothetical protein
MDVVDLVEGRAREDEKLFFPHFRSGFREKAFSADGNFSVN